MKPIQIPAQTYIVGRRYAPQMLTFSQLQMFNEFLYPFFTVRQVIKNVALIGPDYGSRVRFSGVMRLDPRVADDL